MSIPEDQRSFPTPRRNLLRIVQGGSLFLALALILRLTAVIPLWAAALLALPGLAAMVMAASMWRNPQRFALRLEDDALVIGAVYPQRYEWRHLSGFRVDGRRRSRVVFDGSDTYDRSSAWRRSYRESNGCDGTLPSTYGWSAEALVERLNAELRSFRIRQAGVPSLSAGTPSSDSQPFAAFLAAFPACGDVHRWTAAWPESIDAHAPTLLKRFWREVGSGSFGDGFLQVLPPDAPIDADLLGRWLRRDGADPERIPFARTAFGDYLYWRDLRGDADDSQHDAEDGAGGDFSVLSINHRKIWVLAWTPLSFFSALASDLESESELFVPRYRALRATLPAPTREQSWQFQPMLALGGSPETADVAVVDAQVHAELALQMALSQ